jgi:hypothetical protein
MNLTRTIGVIIYCYKINFIVTSKSRTQKKQLIVIDQLWHLVRQSVVLLPPGPRGGPILHGARAHTDRTYRD